MAEIPVWSVEIDFGGELPGENAEPDGRFVVRIRDEDRREKAVIVFMGQAVDDCRRHPTLKKDGIRDQLVGIGEIIRDQMLSALGTPNVCCFPNEQNCIPCDFAGQPSSVTVRKVSMGDRFSAQVAQSGNAQKLEVVAVAVVAANVTAYDLVCVQN